jgi:hypothetical protein
MPGAGINGIHLGINGINKKMSRGRGSHPHLFSPLRSYKTSLIRDQVSMGKLVDSVLLSRFFSSSQSPRL